MEGLRKGKIVFEMGDKGREGEEMEWFCFVEGERRGNVCGRDGYKG